MCRSDYFHGHFQCYCLNVKAEDRTDEKLTLVTVKFLPEPMLTQNYGATRPQWVNNAICLWLSTTSLILIRDSARCITMIETHMNILKREHGITLKGWRRGGQGVGMWRWGISESWNFTPSVVVFHCLVSENLLFTNLDEFGTTRNAIEFQINSSPCRGTSMDKLLHPI